MLMGDTIKLRFLQHSQSQCTLVTKDTENKNCQGITFMKKKVIRFSKLNKC